MDWKKKILAEAFAPEKPLEKSRVVLVAPVKVIKEPTKAEKKSLIEELVKEIKEKKLLDVLDLKNGQSIIYPNKKQIDQRWHGAGVTKIIAGTGISIVNTGDVPGLSDVTITATASVNDIIENETPAGAVDGVNMVFTTVFNFVASTTHLYLNGLRQQLIGDYTETAANQITFVSAPLAGDILIIDYQKT